MTSNFRMSKVYVASRMGNIEIPLNVRDSEETLEEAFKSQQKMNAKMNDPIVVANKQNMNATSSVKRPKSRDSHVKTSVLDVSKNEAKKEAVYVRKNKQTDNTFAKVVSNKENVIDVAVANASKAKTFVMRSSSKSKIDEASASKARDKVSSEFKKKKRNMRDKPLSPFMLNKIRTSSLWQKWLESQPNVTWTPVNTKTHAHTNPSNTKPLVSVKRWIVKLPVVHVLTFLVLQVVHIVLWVVDSGCSNHMTGDHSLLRNFVEKFMGTVRFGNDNFAAIVFNGKVSIRFMEKCRLCSFIIFCY
ncbi:hypothetical protein Tco_0054541 [Tanacetum coccineum]